MEDQTGALWIGTHRGGVIRLKNGVFTTFTTRDGLVSNDAPVVYEDKKGNLWFGTPAGLTMRALDGRVITFTRKNGLLCDYIYSLCEKDNGELWIGTNTGLFRMNIKERNFIYYGSHEGLPNPQVMCLYEDRDRNLWGGTDGGGVFRAVDGKIETFSLEDGMACRYIYSIQEDREGSLWIGTLEGGLHRLRDTTITPYTTKEGLHHDVVEYIYEDREEGLWISTNGGINRLKNGKLSAALSTEQGLLSNFVNAILEDSSGALWIGTDAGLQQLKQKRLTSFTTRDGIPHNRISYLLEDTRGDILLGTLNGLSRFHEGKFTTFIRKEELLDNNVTFLHEDREGNLWVGTEDGLHRLKDGELTTYTTREGLEDNTMQCIYEDSEGILYFGSRGGLTCRVDGAFTNYTHQNGLIDNFVYSILEDDKGKLWLAGRTGISCIRKRELADFAEGKIKTIHPISYNEQDGMKTSWCNPGGEKSRDGKLWFATNKGMVMIDPANIKKNTQSPPVIIEELIVDGEPVDFKGKPLEIPPGIKRLEFSYTGLSFIKPRKMKFKLRLDGYDTDWIDVGDARSTIYTQLSPGKYTLKVIACNSDGVWNHMGASLSFYMKPYFYQTIWFYILVVLAVFFFVFSSYRFRVRQLKSREKKLSAEVAERTRVLNKRTRQLEHAHDVIKEKNRNILDSIRYARRIQQAILPAADRMRMVLEDYFIIFKPRDIVSGDFYWFGQNEDNYFIAAVDCTGHGVPGALLSMIGNMMLNEIVSEKSLSDPAQLLSNLHQGVRSALKQENREAMADDGMDVGVCMFDLKKGKITFAGAGRPLYYIKNSDLFEIKGDRKAIGGRQKEEHRTFTNHTIDFPSGVTLYLTTDGFVDQSNQKNKKYGSQRLKQFLKTNAHLSMDQQKEALLKELDSHQGKEEQRDDITIIGIKLKKEG
jgi:ligand-binding sensor domain-containing protein/serine phosphatase RsbU (regulator of sigma subunit)